MTYIPYIGKRISPELVHIDDEPALKTKARKETRCVYSRNPIMKGDFVYRPLSNSSTRSSRWLASEIEKLEQEQALRRRP